MESRYIENITPAYDGTSTLALVCKLLTEMLVEDDKQLIISSRPEGYIYDSTKAIGITNPVQILILSAEQTKNGTRTEVTMSGVIKWQGSGEQPFSLYFTMQGEVPSSIYSMHKETLVGKHLALDIVETTGTLYDSLYSLILQYPHTSRGESPGGEGRGYLVFGKAAKNEKRG